MALRDNFDPDLIYEVIWSGGELLPPRPERTSSSWSTGGSHRHYNQTGNHREVADKVTLPSFGEDLPILPTLEHGDQVPLLRYHDLDEAIRATFKLSPTLRGTRK